MSSGPIVSAFDEGHRWVWPNFNILITNSKHPQDNGVYEVFRPRERFGPLKNSPIRIDFVVDMETGKISGIENYNDRMDFWENRRLLAEKEKPAI